jgi:hypothetical protein
LQQATADVEYGGVVKSFKGKTYEAIQGLAVTLLGHTFSARLPLYEHSGKREAALPEGAAVHVRLLPASAARGTVVWAEEVLAPRC